MSPSFEKSADFGNSEEFFSNELNEEDLTIWVDPLDGSKGMTEGHMHHVACMIGVSVKNRPRLGIVHKPFSSYPFPGSGRTYVGIPESGLFAMNLITDSYGDVISTNPTYLPPFD